MLPDECISAEWLQAEFKPLADCFFHSEKVFFEERENTSCSSVDRMSERNKEEFTGSRDEVISMGYEPCGNCNP